MKKLFTFIALLATLLPSITLRAENYGLSVAGVSVTDANKDNITGSGISGKITYKPTSKQLILADGTSINTSVDGIRNLEVDGLSIIFEGDVTITTNCTNETAAGIICWKNTSLSKWSGTKAHFIKIENTGAGGAIHSYQGARIRSYGLWIDARSSNNHAIRDLSPGTGSFEVIYSRIFAKGGSGKVAYSGFTKTDGIRFDASALEVASYKFDAGQGGVVNSSGSLVNSCWIEPTMMLGRLYIGSSSEITLSSAKTNATSASGKLQWNSSTKTLTLNDVNVEGSFFVIREPGITIKVNGDCAFSTRASTSDNGMSLYADATIEGEGTLKLTSAAASGLSCYSNANVTLKLKELQALGKTYGVQAGGTLTLQAYSDATQYKFAGETSNVKVSNLVMEDVDISISNTYWKAVDGFVYYNGSIDKSTTIVNGTWFKSKSKIAYLSLWIGGEQMRANNTQYFYPRALKSGSAKYDTSSKTLTLDGATINATGDDYGIYHTIDGLTITTTGTNSITAADIAIRLGANTTIKGSGDLTVKSTEEHAIDMRNNSGLTLQRSGGTMTVEAKKYGYYGYKETNLAINKDGANGALYKFLGEEGNIYNTGLAMGDGVNVQSKWTWYNADDGAFYLHDDLAKGTDHASGATWIRGDVTWTEYPITIAGTKLYGAVVDGDLKGNAGGFCNKYYTGSDISYAPDTKTLSLTDVNLTYDDEKAIRFEASSDVTVNVSGNNTITGTGFYGIQIRDYAKVAFTGSGTINITGARIGLGLWGTNSVTTVKGDVTLTATGATLGIGGENSGTRNGSLVVSENAVVKANKINKIYALTLNDDHAIVAPAGATYKSEGIYVGEALAEDVVIDKVVKYDLKVNDRQVTSVNAADILGDGQFSYDGESQTLTMTDVTFNYTESGGALINNTGVDGLTINIVGDNNITLRSGAQVVYTNVATTLKGTGSLTANEGFYIVSTTAKSAKLTIDGPTVTLNTGSQRSIFGWNEAPDAFAILSGKLTVNTSALPIHSIESFELGAGMYITTPEGGQYNASLGGISVNGSSLYSGNLVIEGATAYDLYVAGTTVTSVNHSDVLGDGIFSYDDATKTLTINGDYTHTGASNIVSSSIDGLTVEVTGNSKLTSTTEATILRFRAPVTITGGKLTLETTYTDGSIAIYNSYGDLTIRNAEIEIVGDGFTYAITGEPAYNLIIENSDIVATASVFGAIVDWGNITLTNCYIDSPRPAVAENNAIRDGEGNVIGLGQLGTVIIKRGADAINGIGTTETAPADVYDVAGRRLDNVSRGINIVRTADGKVRKVLKK